MFQQTPFVSCRLLKLDKESILKLSIDSPNIVSLQEAESVVAASRKAREEALSAKQRIESNMLHVAS